jgi:hypothetical protein
VSDLHQREVDTHPQAEALRNWEQRAQRYADETMKKADAGLIMFAKRGLRYIELKQRERERFSSRESHILLADTGNDWLRTPVSRL